MYSSGLSPNRAATSGAPTRKSRAADRNSQRIGSYASSFFAAMRRAGAPGVPDLLGELVESGNYSAIIGHSIDPTSYSDVDAFQRDYACVSLLSKYPGFDLGIDRKKVALQKFFEAEYSCLLTNLRLKPGISGLPETYARHIVRARKYISVLLGTCDLARIEPFTRFSGGASTRLKRRCGDAVYKFSGIPHCTSRAHDLARLFVSRVPDWYSRLSASSARGTFFTPVESCRVTTVPKNAKTDRTIGIEPDMNMYCQLGVGGFMKSRLKTFGIDLFDQTFNQNKAYEGSITGNLATIDLKAASDTVSRELVKLLLPSDWYSLLDSLRTHTALISEHDDITPIGLKQDRVISLEKFSSMGNGFTFELETLIFWALALSVCDARYRDPNVLVYGDDIIVPSDKAAELIELLQFCGFETNKDKTFLSGPFRESCGKHYFEGRDVTPIYARNALDSDQHLFHIANNTTRLASRLGMPGLFKCASLLNTWNLVVSWLPPSAKRKGRFIPDGVGDGGLVMEFDEATPRLNSMGWYSFKHLVPKTVYCDDPSYTSIAKRRRETSVSGGSDSDGFQSPSVITAWLYRTRVASPSLGVDMSVNYWQSYKTSLNDLPFFRVARLKVGVNGGSLTAESWAGPVNQAPTGRESYTLARGACREWSYLGCWA